VLNGTLPGFQRYDCAPEAVKVTGDPGQIVVGLGPAEITGSGLTVTVIVTGKLAQPLSDPDTV
jgi:hypothetical protein